MFKATPRQFIYMNNISEKIVVVGYDAAEAMYSNLAVWTFIGEV